MDGEKEVTITATRRSQLTMISCLCDYDAVQIGRFYTRAEVWGMQAVIYHDPFMLVWQTLSKTGMGGSLSVGKSKETAKRDRFLGASGPPLSATDDA